MYKLNFNKKESVHFIGIGGISMSGLAEILIDKGFKVSGSDQKENSLTDSLTKKGAKISYPQSENNIKDDTDFFVYTAAIHPDNPEFKKAKETGKPMLTRAELLGEIMEHYENSIAISGTHGKTTTTSMISEVLLEAALSPTISVGGIIPSIQSNIHLGSSDIFVTEACEYTDSFLSFYPKYTIVLNIDAEHLDYFKNLENERKSFRKFLHNTKPHGAIYINGSIENVDILTEGVHEKIIKFGLSEDFDCYAEDITYDKNGHPSFIPIYNKKEYDRITLSVPGLHNVVNSLSAIALLIDIKVPYEKIKKGLLNFKGANRRFQYKGSLKNGAVIVDDYAHHPTEIRASLLAALKTVHKRIIVCFQPHTYTRTKTFLHDFADSLSIADVVVLSDIYAAREKDIYNISSLDIKKLLDEKGKECYYFHTFSEIEKFLLKFSKNGDLLITMGAGDIVNVGEDLLK